VTPVFEKLLVAMDGTAESHVALPFARVLAQACRSRLVLVRVVDSAVLSPDECQSQSAQALEELKRIANDLYTSGIYAEARVGTGDAATEILRTAEAEQADALIIATHASLLERLLDTSTARRLLARSRLPVFVLRPGGPPVTHIQNVVAAVDGSPGGAQALDQAVALARLTGAALVLVRVISPPVHFGFDPLLSRTLGAPSHGESDERARAAAEQYVNELVAGIRARGVNATPCLMVGSPAERIVTAAAKLDADLIVMSTHGYLAPLRTLLGSTADRVVQTARRPVLLIRKRRVGSQPDHTNVSEPAIVGPC
jgi:nucleotide-binding universal stress UspA family protein